MLLQREPRREIIARSLAAFRRENLQNGGGDFFGILVVHPDAGHDLPQDDGPWVAERIRLWLEDPLAAPWPT